MRKTKWTFTLTLALIFAMSATAMAVPPPPPFQTPLSPTKIPQFAQPIDLLDINLTDLNGATQIPTVIDLTDLSGATNVDVSICEFQTNILPPGTFGKNTPAPATYVWGYQVNDTDPETSNLLAPGECNTGLVSHSYLGPVVVADRHDPTRMNFYNRLPNANTSNVKAYTTSNDQSLIWGDPLSLNMFPPPINLRDADPTLNPEKNDCWQAAQAWIPGVTLSLPAPCLNNYGFLAPHPTDPATERYEAPTPAAVHIHGGEVPSVLDGGPDSWWTGSGIYGHGYYSKGGPEDAEDGMATYVYPNGQEAAPVWFHDHMLGATRLNVYAGIAGGYVIKEPASTLAPGLHPLGLSDATWTPGDGETEDNRPLTELVQPIIIQDRMFDTAGQLYFPNVGINPEHPFWVPEFVGDVIVVNGKAWPYMNVQPKRYKFIFLNGSNARAYELFLLSKTTGLRGPMMWVVGNDQGYLDTAQPLDPNLNLKLAMMPGERYEVVIDFTGLDNQIIEMRNTARTPYVGGAPVNGNTTGKIMQFWVGPGPVVDNSFNPAVSAQVRANPMVRLTPELSMAPAAGVTIHKIRRLTVNEVIGAGGPLEVLVNNTLYDGSKDREFYLGEQDFTDITSLWNTSWYSELPHEGETELWEIVNLTADAHPMHPHLVAFQVLNRQPLDVLGYMAAYNAAYAGSGMPIDGYGPPYNYNNSGNMAADPGTGLPLCSTTAPARGDANYVGTFDPATGAITATCVLGGNPDPALVGALLGPPVPPMTQEIGWKDTVQALPNMVTRFLVRFGKADLPADASADSVGYDFSPNGGHGYVWHCHIVDHEDNEMMRPYTVYENPNILARSYVKGTDY